MRAEHQDIKNLLTEVLDTLSEIEAEAAWTANAVEELYIARVNDAEFSVDFEHVFTDGVLENLRRIGKQAGDAHHTIWHTMNETPVDRDGADTEA